MERKKSCRRPSDFHSVADCSSKLGVSEDTVRRLLGAGVLRGMRVRTAWRVVPADLQAFIASRTNSPIAREAA